VKRFLLAHDLGTSGDKATLFTFDGELVDSRVSAYPTVYLNDTWAEQDSELWWTAVCSSTRSLLQGRDPADVAAVCFSGQMMGCLCVDRRGRPLHNSLIYCDQRAEPQARSLVERLSPAEVYRTTGHRVSSSYSVEKLMWVRDNEPDVYRATDKMLNAKDYLNFRLTGVLCTDHNDASGTNAFDLRSLSWSARVLEAAGIAVEKLPRAVQSTAVIGEVTREAAEASGLRPGTPVVAGAGDGGCATVGTGSVVEGVTYNYLGSSSWISATTKQPVYDDQERTFTWAHPVPGLYQPCGTMQTAGASYAWVRSQLCACEEQEARASAEDVYEIINREIELSPPGSHGVLFLPYLLGERSPRWNPHARGAWIGLGLETKRSDILRSVLEGVSMNLALILDIMRASIDPAQIILIGGGAKGRLWRQMLADVYGLPVVVPAYLEEATSMGAAIIGGVGVGVFPDFRVVDRFVRVVETVFPRADAAAVYRARKPLFDECYKLLEPAFGRL
jgi:xylulokinase